MRRKIPKDEIEDPKTYYQREIYFAKLIIEDGIPLAAVANNHNVSKDHAGRMVLTGACRLSGDDERASKLWNLFQIRGMGHIRAINKFLDEHYVRLNAEPFWDFCF